MHTLSLAYSVVIDGPVDDERLAHRTGGMGFLVNFSYDAASGMLSC
jgi:hypothetical protein